MSKSLSPITKYLIEVRYPPIPTILDKRGQIAQDFQNELFDTWKISKERIDFSSKTNPNAMCFVSFINSGFSSDSPNEKDLFVEKSKDFIKKVWNYTNPDWYSRVGVRIISFLPREESFKVLLDKYRKKFTQFQTEKLPIFDNAKLLDIGLSLNFIDDNPKVKFNLMTGPMKKEQALDFFNNSELLSDIGIFFDIDYFTDVPNDVLKRQKDHLIFIDSAIDRAERIQKSVLKALDEGDIEQKAK